MPNSYDDIDFCLNLLYDMVYGKSTECYELRYESKTNIDTELLKKGESFDYSRVFDTKIEFKMVNNNRVIFERASDTSYPCLIKAAPYIQGNKYELFDMKLNYILSDLSINDVYKYTLLPIMNFDVGFDELKKSHKHISDVLKEHLDINDNPIICFQVFERYFKTETLTDFLNNKSSSFLRMDWKVLCFQILYALYKIQKAYPTFRHNNLDLNSIYVCHITKPSEDIIVKIGDSAFAIPNNGYEIKLTNFYNSTIKNISQDTNFDNQYYDVFSIFNSLLRFASDKKINDLTNFLNDVVPEMFRTNNKNTIELDEAYYQSSVVTVLNPFIILSKNNFFIDLIKENMHSALSNKKEDLGSFQLEDSSIEYILSSSMSETGNGSRPSNFGRPKNNTISGKRKLAVHGSQYNMIGGKRKTFNDYGELTETEPESEKEKPKKKKDDDSEDDSESEEPTASDEENDDDEDDEDAEDDIEDEDSASDELVDDEEPATEKPPSESGTNMFMQMMNGRSIKKKDNGLFKEIEKLGNKRRAEMGMAQMAHAAKTTKKPRKGKKGKKSRTSLDSDLHGALMSKLPGNYEGMLPDWLQSVIPGQNGMPQMGMPQMGMPQMPGMPGMPQMPGMPGTPYDASMMGAPQDMMPPQGMPTMSPQMPQTMQMPQAMPPMSPTQHMPQMNNTPQMPMQNMPQMPMNNAPMNNAPMEMSAPAAPQSINTQDHTSLLPQNLLMNSQQSGGRKRKIRNDENFFF